MISIKHSDYNSSRSPLRWTGTGAIFLRRINAKPFQWFSRWRKFNAYEIRPKFKYPFEPVALLRERRSGLIRPPPLARGRIPPTGPSPPSPGRPYWLRGSSIYFRCGYLLFTVIADTCCCAGTSRSLVMVAVKILTLVKQHEMPLNFII